MTTAPIARRRGARRMSEIPPEVLAALNRGELETANLVEWLATDQRKLARHVLASRGTRQSRGRGARCRRGNRQADRHAADADHRPGVVASGRGESVAPFGLPAALAPPLRRGPELGGLHRRRAGRFVAGSKDRGRGATGRGPALRRPRNGLAGGPAGGRARIGCSNRAIEPTGPFTSTRGSAASPAR